MKLNYSNMKYNLNDIIKALTLSESGKKQVDIAQVKDLMNNLFTQNELETITQMWLKYNKDRVIKVK